MGFGGGILHPHAMSTTMLRRTKLSSVSSVILLLGLMLLSVDASGGDSTQIGYACEGLSLTISCSEGQTLQILRANYGRLSLSVCSDGRDPEGWTTQCMSTRSLDIVSRLCDGKPICWISATNNRFGDPCSNTPKYLEVQFECVEARESTIHLTRPPTTASPSQPDQASSTKPVCASSKTRQTIHEKLLPLAPTSALKHISRLFGSRLLKDDKRVHHGNVDKTERDADLATSAECQDLHDNQEEGKTESSTAVTVPVKWRPVESASTFSAYIDDNSDKDINDEAFSNNASGPGHNHLPTKSDFYYYAIYDDGEDQISSNDDGTPFEMNRIPDHVDIDNGATWDLEDNNVESGSWNSHHGDDEDEESRRDSNLFEGTWSGAGTGESHEDMDDSVVTHPTRPPPPPTTTTTEATTTSRATPRPTMTPTPQPTLAPTPEPTTTEKPTTTTTAERTPVPTTTTEKVTTEEPLRTPPPLVDAKYCEPKLVRNISWPRTREGKEAAEPCPNNPTMFGYYACGLDPVEWIGNPDLTFCASTQLKHLQNVEETIDSVDDLTHVSSQMLHITETDLYGGDVRELSMMLNEIVEDVEVETMVLPDSEQKNTINVVNEDIIKASSNLLSESHSDSWKDLPQSTQAESAANIMEAVESSAKQVANLVTPLEPPTVKIEVHIMMAVDAVDTTTTEVQDVCFPDPSYIPAEHDKWAKSGDMIRLPGGTVKKLGREGMAKLIFLTYENLDKLLNAPQKDSANAIAKIEMPEKGKNEENTPEEDDHIFTGGGVAIENIPDDAYEFQTPIDYVGKLEDDYHYDNRILEVEEEPKEMIINSNIISATINDETVRTDNLPENITYTLAHKTTQNVYNPTCSFWEYSERMMDGKWSTFGCSLVSTNLTHTTCTCNHLTNFAILMDVVGTALPTHHTLTLSLITYVGVFISLICLLFCWLTFQFCKNLQCDRNTIHKHLVFNLFIAELLFVAGIGETDDDILCSVIAGFLHYFFLVAFSWMCLEGIQLYMMLIEVFEAEKSRGRWFYLSAYGIPAVIVLICAAAYPEGYGTEDYCWLDVPSGFIWAFVAPVIIIITINIGMLSVAIYVMCRHAQITSQLKMREKSRMEKISDYDERGKSSGHICSGILPSLDTCDSLATQASQTSAPGITDNSSNHDNKTDEVEEKEPEMMGWVKGAVVLVVLLGLTWSIGLLYINEQTVALAYIFTILNSLQGLFIFIFHCLMDERVQKEYKRCVRHQTWLPDCIRVNYGGAKAYTSSSPNSSTSGNNYLQKLLSGRRRKRSSTTSLPKSSRSSGVPPWKWHYQNMQPGDVPNGNAPPPPFLLPNSGPEDYLEPVRTSIDNDVFPPIENEYATINGADLSMIDASTVDTEGLSEYCEKQLAIDFEKYKIQSPVRERPLETECDYSEIDEKDDQLSDATLARLREKEKMLEDYADHALDSLVPRSESEQNLVNKLDDSSIRKKRYSSSSGSSCRESPSLNDLNNLNKERLSDTSNKSLNISTPNIKFKAGTLKKNNTPNSSGDEGMYNSLPNLSDGQVATEDVAIDKLRKLTPPEDEGLITIAHGRKPQQRLSTDTEQALKAHNMRPTSSDC